MKPDEFIDSLLVAAKNGAKPHFNSLEGFLKKQATYIGKAALEIEADRLRGFTTRKQAKIAFHSLERSVDSVHLVVKATLQIAAQDAINAALSVAANTLKKSIGLAL